MGRSFTKLSREQRDEIGPLYGKESPAATAERYGISEVYVRTVQWRWAKKNNVPLEGHKRKAAAHPELAGFSLFGPALEAYLSDYKCEPVPPDLLTAHGVTLLDREPHQCAWPIGVDIEGRRRFCGRQRYDGKS